MLSTFLADESGAVTVDWVVLTGGLVGLGLATMAVVSGGVASLSGDTSSQLSGQSIISRFAMTAEVFATDFSGGIGDWLGGNVVDLAGFGEVLQLGPGEIAQMQLSLPPGTTSATISFDMIGGDDLDGEPATILINGQPVAVYSDDHGNITLSDNAVPGVTVSVEQQYRNDPVGAGTHGSDSRATYTISVDNPGTTLTFGVSSGANQGTANEFYALDDVAVTTN